MTCTIVGLSPATMYTVTVVATNAVGSSAASAGATVTTPQDVVVPPIDGPDLIGVEPARLLETRPDAMRRLMVCRWAAGLVGAGRSWRCRWRVVVGCLGWGGCVLNVTVVGPGATGFAMLFRVVRGRGVDVELCAGGESCELDDGEVVGDAGWCVFSLRTDRLLDIVGYILRALLSGRWRRCGCSIRVVLFDD